jgi:hypothetical protein
MDGRVPRGKIMAAPASVLFFDAGSGSTPPSLIIGKPISVTINRQGVASLMVPVTDDTDIAPVGFTYTITEKLSTGTRSYVIEVPYSAHVHGIDLATVAPVSVSPGTPVSLVTKAELVALAARVTSVEAGEISGAATQTDFLAHINSSTPHPAYDDQPDLSLIFENGLVGP